MTVASGPASTRGPGPAITGPASTRGPGAAIELAGVAKRYGDRSVLADLTVSVAAGELVALLGPNGAGKTTTVEILEGYRAADAGVVRVLGVDVRTGGPGLRARVGLMLQGGGLDPRATPRDLLRLYARFHDPSRDPGELLDAVGLRAVAANRVRRLSGGERQRLALALALVGRPEVLILDEPTAGMDPEARRTTRALIAEQQRDGAAILLTTHDLGDVERLADRVVILHGGRIVADGSPAAIAAGAIPRLRFRLAAPLDAPAIASLAEDLSRVAPGALVTPDAGDARAHAVDGVPSSPALVSRLAAWAEANSATIVELRTGSATLEERYLELTGDRAVEAGA